MARIKIEDIINNLSRDMNRTLEDAVKRTIPDADFDRHKLFREFRKAVGRKCSTWENVPDIFIDK